MQERLLNSPIVLSFISLFERAIPLLLLPFLTKYLSVENYGYLYTYLVIITLLTPILNIGFSNYQGKQYYREDNAKRKQIFGTYLYFQGIIFFILFIISVPTYFLINNIIGYDLRFYLVLIIIGTAFFQNTLNTAISYFKISYRFKLVGLISFLKVILDICFTILFVFLLSGEWYGRLFSMFFVVTILSLVSYLFLIRKNLIVIGFDKEVLRSWFNFGKHIIIHRISSIILNLSDRLLITFILGALSTGLYTVGYQIASIIGVVATAINQAWSPWFFKYYNSKVYTKKKVNTYAIYIILMVLAAYIILVFSSPYLLPLYIDIEKYNGIYKFINIIGFGLIFQAIYFCYMPFIIANNNSKLLSKISFISALTNVALNIVFLKAYGVIIAAYSTAFSWFLQGILVFFYHNNNKDKQGIRLYFCKKIKSSLKNN